VQLEYSLLERTAEGELFPMAQEMGIGIMPWSPLKHGFLSGKFRRENAGSVDTKRTAMDVPSETDYLVIDALCAVAEEVGATAAAVALAWVWSRPGVESTLIGARRPDQLEANLAALELMLTDAQNGSAQRGVETSAQFPGRHQQPFGAHVWLPGHHDRRVHRARVTRAVGEGKSLLSHMLTQHAYAIRRETSCSLRKALLIRLDPNRLPPLAELMGQPGARPAPSRIPSISSALSMRKRRSTRPIRAHVLGPNPPFPDRQRKVTAIERFSQAGHDGPPAPFTERHHE